MICRFIFKDGDKDCMNGRDEENCTHSTSTESNHKTDNIMPTCHDWMYQCNNDRCVPHWWKWYVRKKASMKTN